MFSEFSTPAIVGSVPGIIGSTIRSAAGGEVARARTVTVTRRYWWGARLLDAVPVVPGAPAIRTVA